MNNSDVVLVGAGIMSATLGVFLKELNPNLKYSQRIYPHINDTIGFYICLLKRIR